MDYSPDREDIFVTGKLWNKENSWVPRMIHLVHPAKMIDLVESKSKDIG